MEKLCVFCKHWKFSGGERGYSEYTPGIDATMDCAKMPPRHYPRLDDCDNEDDFREAIEWAKTCPHYSPPSNEG